MGDYRKRNRVGVFKSVQDQEVHKIDLMLQVRYEDRRESQCGGVCCRH